jgi:3D (Asp-Asp-Asp) domain-containing protein
VRRFALAFVVMGVVVGSAACGWGSGSSWMQQPLSAEEERASMSSEALGGNGSGGAGGHPQTRTIGGDQAHGRLGAGELDRTGGGGHVLGTFRNTYYDFPNEAAGSGPPVSLMNASCQPIAQVPRSFFEAVCVQGSGSLAKGGTVSFAKRDCACAEVCPRTGQKICFEALDAQSYPWGRGAAGVPIAPLRSVAADTSVLPMGTVIYIPELDGVSAGSAVSDGCFVVEDRGLRVQGEHVDVFTGIPAHTAALNAAVPSNQGVTVVVDAPKCAHLGRRSPR